MKRIIKYCYPLLGALASCSAPAGQTGGLPSAPTPAQGTAAPQATAAQPLPATVPAGRSPWSPHVRSYSTPAGGTLFFKEACEQPAHAGEARCLALTQSDPDGTISSSTTPSGWGASDLQSAYRIPTTGGAGTTVAIVDANDDPNAETDLAIYRYQYGLPPCTTANGCFHKLNQAGAATPTPAADPGWSTEISLDLDMVSAACPLCNILLVEANSSNTNDLEAAEHTAVANGATFISNSWASSEFAGEESGNSSAFNYPGVAIFASSGDGGYGVGYPAASAFVTAVGGTTLTQATTLPNGGTNLRGWSETAWGGAGSGCSAYIAKPSWQHDTGCANRTVADLSAIADPGTPVAVYDSYGFSRSENAWSGRPLNRSQASCFKENFASATNTCAGAAQIWELPLVVDGGGPFTIDINVTPTSNLQSVGCMAASLNEDSTPSQSTYSSGLVYPTEANRAQGLTMSGISVPGGGSLYAACWVTEGGRINSVNWRVNQGWITLGGTSVASPLVTSIFAVTGNVGATPSFSYSNPSDFFDVTSGSNGSCGSYLCNAGPGYDGPTGNGTPNGALML